LKIPRLFVEIPQLCPRIPRKLSSFRSILSKFRNLEMLVDFFQQTQESFEHKKAPIRKESELFNIISMVKSRYVCVVLCHLNMF
jgi:hypothetical protein